MSRRSPRSRARPVSDDLRLRPQLRRGLGPVNPDVLRLVGHCDPSLFRLVIARQHTIPDTFARSLHICKRRVNLLSSVRQERETLHAAGGARPGPRHGRCGRGRRGSTVPGRARRGARRATWGRARRRTAPRARQAPRKPSMSGAPDGEDAGSSARRYPPSTGTTAACAKGNRGERPRRPATLTARSAASSRSAKTFTGREANSAALASSSSVQRTLIPRPATTSGRTPNQPLPTASATAPPASVRGLRPAGPRARPTPARRRAARTSSA